MVEAKVPSVSEYVHDRERVFEKEIRDLRKQLRHWRLLVFYSLFALFLSGGLFYYQVQHEEHRIEAIGTGVVILPPGVHPEPIAPTPRSVPPKTS